MINVIHNSKEDYLEAILMIQEEKGRCRSIDIAEHLNFSRPSVSNAVKKLEAENLIERKENGELLLTDEGLKIASYTLQKHHFIMEILLKVGVDPEIAENDACLLEHSLSDESYRKIKAYIEKGE